MTKAFKTGINAPAVSVNGTAVSVEGHTHAGGGGAPTDATYVVTSANTTLTNERVLTQGSYLTITDNGSSTVTVAVDATSANTASKVVARDASGNFSAGTITAALTGNASTASALSSAKTITLSGDVTGSVSTDLSTGPTITTAIGSGVIVDADISATAAIGNSKLANSSITVNGTVISLGGSGTVTAAAGTLTGTALNSTVTGSSLTSFGASPTVTTPALTLSTTTSTTEGRIAWDATNDQIEVGTGTTLATFGQLATTATVTPAALGTAARGASSESARTDHVHPTTGVVPDTRTVAGTAPITVNGVSTTGQALSGNLTIAAAAASTSAAGVVQLSDSTATTSSVLAATPTAVKSAYDLANAAVPKSTVTTAGDLILGTGPSAVTKLGIGTNGQVLTSNGTTATWAAPAAVDSGWKLDVRVATTAALTGTGTLTYSSANGTFTWATAGPTTIDGVTLANGDRILVKDEGANALRNGIYVRTSTTVLTRATDGDTAAEIAASAVNVLSGTTNGGTLWTTNFKSTDTLGTTAMNWYQAIDSSGASFTGNISTTGTVSASGLAGSLLSSATPVANSGTGVVGTAAVPSRQDHAHPTTGLVTTASLGTNVATFLGTPSSANLIAAVTDETGTGSLVFGTTPTIATPLLTLSTTSSTADGRIYWDSTTDEIKVGNGTTAVVFSSSSLASSEKWSTT